MNKMKLLIGLGLLSLAPFYAGATSDFRYGDRENVSFQILMNNGDQVLHVGQNTMTGSKCSFVVTERGVYADFNSERMDQPIFLRWGLWENDFLKATTKAVDLKNNSADCLAFRSGSEMARRVCPQGANHVTVTYDRTNGQVVTVTYVAGVKGPVSQCQF